MKTNIYFCPYLAQFFLERKNATDKGCTENKNTFYVQQLFFFSKNMPFMRECEKILYSRTGHILKNEACALHAGYLRLQTHIQNM